MAVAYITLDSNSRTSSYTLTKRDVAEPGLILMNSASSNQVIVPIMGLIPFKPGESLVIIQMGAGQTTVVAASHVTISVNSALTLVLTGQYSAASLMAVGQDAWVLAGDLVAA